MKAPDAFRTISEVAEDLDLPQHVLRFWETRFGQIKPMKRGGGRRYYRPEDIDLLRGIRLLLYSEGFTIRGVQRLLKERGVGFVVAVGQSGSMQAAAAQRGRADTAVTIAADHAEPAAADPIGEEGDAPAEASVATAELSLAPAPARVVGLSQDSRRRLEAVLSDLLEARRLLDQVR
jgi:DNA-binding transcriptional MerR regulator